MVETNKKQAKVIEQVKKIEKLGKGGQGVAYLVEGCESKSINVMKEINISEMDEKDRKDALQEAKILQTLNHPNIIKSHDVYKTKKGMLCILMEYADNGDLSTIIKSKKKILKAGNTEAYFAEEEILEIFCQICIALKYVHDRNILHRDIKSQNIFLTKDMQVKIGDFGIAKILENSKSKAETMVGTPLHFSPEMCKGEKYDNKSDIWALGVLLYQLCCLDFPFKGQCLSNLIMNITTSKPKDIPHIYSRDMRSIVKTMLRKDPKGRPSLERLLSHEYLKTAMSSLLQKYPTIQNFMNEEEQEEEFIKEDADGQSSDDRDDEDSSKSSPQFASSKVLEKQSESDQDENLLQQDGQQENCNLTKTQFIEKMKDQYGEKYAINGFEIISQNIQLSFEEDSVQKINDLLSAQGLEFSNQDEKDQFIDCISSYIIMSNVKY